MRYYYKIKSIVYILLCISILFLSFAYSSASLKPKISGNTINEVKEKEVLVKLEENASIGDLKDEYKVKDLDLNATGNDKEKLKSWVSVEIKSQSDIEKLKQDQDVELVQVNYKRKLFLTPNDPYYESTGYSIPIENGQWALRRIGLTAINGGGVDTGWEVNTGSASTVVAVIDTGIDITHPDLSGNLWVNTDEIAGNGIDDDNNGYIDDYNGFNFADSLDQNGDGDYNDGSDISNSNPQDIGGHGTVVSGIIAAQTNNNIGISGICWACKIMPLRIINSQGYGFDSDIAKAIRYAVDNGAKVINMSLGGPGYSSLLEDASDYAWSHNVVLVSAAGNNASSASDSYPGATKRNISVGGTDWADDVSTWYSNTGKRLDLVAPGSNIISTRLQTSVAGCATGYTLVTGPYECSFGTSLAAPHVAGAIGLLFSQNPSWTASQIRQVILQNTDNLLTAGFDDTSGFGRVNALNALQATSPSSDVTTPIASLAALPATVNGTINITGTASDASLYLYKISVSKQSDGFIVKEISGRNNITNSILGSINTQEIFNSSTRMPDGNYNIVMTVEDFAGNIATSNTLSITIDNTAPNAFSLISPTHNSATKDPTPQFSWNTSSDLSTPILYDLQVDSGFLLIDSAATTFTPSSGLAQGAHTYMVKAKDSLGNIQNSSSTNTFYVDYTIPADFGINITPSGDSTVFDWSTTDAESVIAFYQMQIDGGGYTTVNSPQTVTVSNGDHIIYIKAVDLAGNERIVSKTFNVNSRNVMLRSKADFNFDGKVSLSDLSILASKWNVINDLADANFDHKTSLSDLSILAQNWNQNF